MTCDSYDDSNYNYQVDQNCDCHVESDCIPPEESNCDYHADIHWSCLAVTASQIQHHLCSTLSIKVLRTLGG